MGTVSSRPGRLTRDGCTRPATCARQLHDRRQPQAVGQIDDRGEQAQWRWQSVSAYLSRLDGPNHRFAEAVGLGKFPPASSLIAAERHCRRGDITVVASDTGKHLGHAARRLTQVTTNRAG
ncbi:MAG: hypothetical protein ABIP03_12625 [Aquihabitans sp.]